jgi:hypothetical protein
MTSLPKTPGDQREDYAQAVADTVAAVYEQAELVLIATVAGLARRVAAGVLTAPLASRQLARATSAALDTVAVRIRAVLDTAAAATRREAGSAFPGAAHVAAPDWTALAESLDAAGDTAAASARDALLSAVAAAGQGTGNVFTPYQQAVDQAIATTRGGLPGSSLSLSRIQAAQKALDELGEQGITGFTDRTGRHWNLTSYVEMATRTAVSRAWDDLQAAALVRSGLDLVLVYTHSLEGSCPQCLPWLGQTLSLTGATPDRPTLAQAKAAGFRHPNCRCSWAALGAGVAAEVTNPVALDRAAAVYRASQHQRALERRVRAAGRRSHAAITPQARAKARRDLASARSVSEAHRRSSGLRMTQVGVKRREHPFRAH